LWSRRDRTARKVLFSVARAAAEFFRPVSGTRQLAGRPHAVRAVGPRGRGSDHRQHLAIFAARHPVEIWCSYIELITAGCPMSAMPPTAAESAPPRNDATCQQRTHAPQQIGMLSSRAAQPFKEFGLVANRSQPELFAGFPDTLPGAYRYRSGSVPGRSGQCGTD
jgi:hypothetical protein